MPTKSKLQAVTPLIDFAEAATAILSVLADALDSYSMLPDSWDGFDTHLATLRKNRIAAVALLLSPGPETAHEAQTIVGQIIGIAAWTKRAWEAGPRAMLREQMQQQHGQLAELVYAIAAALRFIRQAAQPAGNHRTRRRAVKREPTPLTARQVAAVQLFGEHNGNLAAVAKEMGVSRTAAKKLYDKAAGKLGTKAMPKPKTQALPTDRRGQINL